MDPAPQSADNPPPALEGLPAAESTADPDPPPLLETLPPDEPPPPPPPEVIPGPVPLVLAGLESGILGALVMIGWFALDSILERQYWWAMLNLWGAGVYHNRVFSMGLGLATVAGASMHFFLHGLGGAVWSLVAGRMSNFWIHLACSFVAAAAWYYFLMHLFWPVVAPVVSRISPVPATLLAYFLFGAALSRTAYRARQLGAIW